MEMCLCLGFGSCLLGCMLSVYAFVSFGAGEEVLVVGYTVRVHVGELPASVMSSCHYSDWFVPGAERPHFVLSSV